MTPEELIKWIWDTSYRVEVTKNESVIHALQEAHRLGREEALKEAADICDEIRAPNDTKNFSTYEVATIDCAEAIREKLK